MNVARPARRRRVGSLDAGRLPGRISHERRFFSEVWAGLHQARTPAQKRRDFSFLLLVPGQGVGAPPARLRW